MAASPAAQAAQGVRQQAKGLFAELQTPWQDYPVDVELLAALLFELGVERVPGLVLGENQYAGLLQADARLIAVEAGHHPHRQRFSIAHEVGHFVLHYRQDQQSPALFRCSDGDMEISGVSAANTGPRWLYVKREAEANQFAAELLMPETAVRAMYRVSGGQTGKLAAHFDVSAQAMERRLQELRLPVKGRGAQR